MSLTTTGYSGAATFNSSTGMLNIPQYSATTLAFSGLQSGTNTVGAMVVGSGATLSASGAGTIAATSVPASGISGTISATNLPAFTGDATSTAGTSALTLATVNSNVGTYSKLTVNAKGLVTAASALGSSDITTALGYTPANAANLGANNGIATLNSSGQLTSSQIPSSLVGAVVYQGVWNANTNSPTLASGVGTKGFYYKVSVAGTTTIDGISQWNVGDTIIFDGTTWDKIDGVASEVLSVAGRTGVVTLTLADIGAGTSTSALVVGTGGSLSASGTGSITATAMATSGLTGTLTLSQLPSSASYGYLGYSTGSSGSPTVNTVLTLGASAPFATTGNLVAGQFTNTVSGAYECIVQNTSSNSSASTDFVATADTGSDSAKYIDVGINSSTGGAAPFTSALATYIYTDQAELDIGALSTSSPAVNVYVGGGTSSPTKQIGITTTATTFYNQIASSIAGSLTASNPGFSLTQTWNNAAVNFYGAIVNISPTAQGANSRAFAVQNGGTDKMWVDTTGDIWANGSITSANSFVNQSVGNYSWSSRSQLVSGADGSITLLNSGGTGFTSLLLGGSTSSQAGLFTSGTTTKFRLADNSADAPISASLGNFSGDLSSTQTIGVTSTDGLSLSAGTAATSSVQQWSPRSHWQGFGWSVTNTNSQSCDWIAEVQTASGAASPTHNWLLRAATNGGAYTNVIQASSSGITVSAILCSGITCTGVNASSKISTSYAGAASSPAFTTTAAPYSAGTGTTCFPQWFATWGSPTAQTNWSNGTNNGTVFGGLGPSTFTGNWIDLRLGSSATATPAMQLTYAGAMTLASTIAASNLVRGGTLTTAGAATLSGAYAFTGTLTAATTVTFPTTGTLAILGANTFTGLQTLSPPSGIAAYVTAGAIETFIYPNGNSSTAIALQLDNGNQQSLTISFSLSPKFFKITWISIPSDDTPAKFFCQEISYTIVDKLK